MKNIRSTSKLIFLLIIISILSPMNSVFAYSIDFQTTGSIHYVKPSASGDCSSWADACDLQVALLTANSGDQIWVVAGTYKPTTSEDRESSFVLKNGVEIYGGFPIEGGGWENRDWIANVTTLSGDIGMPDDITDNSYHVVTSHNLDSSTIMDGFTIIAGSATGDAPNDSGGGMYNFESSPTLKNLTFQGNLAINGGGMYNESSSPSLQYVVFESNNAIFGGGMNNFLQSNPTITDATFNNNHADTGAGLSNKHQSNPNMSSVTFSNNSASVWGGGMHNELSSPTLTNVTFSSNYAGRGGGGIHNYSQSSPLLTNVTLTGNRGFPFGDALFDQFYSYPTLVHCILWDNTFGTINRMARISYSIIEGGYLGRGNIDLDPMLGPLADNGGFTQTHALAEGSPAIDAGHLGLCPNTDQIGVIRPVDGNLDGKSDCDIGAYEYVPSYLPNSEEAVITGVYTNSSKALDFCFPQLQLK